MARLLVPQPPSLSDSQRMLRWIVDLKRVLEAHDQRLLRWEGADSEDWIGVDGSGNEFALFQIKRTRVTLTGASVTATDFIPASVMNFGVFSEVTATITGATTFDVGITNLTDMFGGTLALTVGTKTTRSDFKDRNPANFDTAQSVVITANGSDFTAGEVELKCLYLPSL